MAEIIGKITPPTEIKVNISSTGAKGDDGFSPSIRIEDIENGHKVIIIDSDGEKTFDVMDGSISESDIDRIIQIVEGAIEPTLDEKQDLLVSGQNIKTVNGESIVGSGNLDIANMQYYKVTYDGTHIQHNGVNLTYQELVDKYNDEDYFLYAEAEGLTMIPSLPPLEDDPILEFTCSWIYNNDTTISRLIINSQNQIKFENKVVAEKDIIPTKTSDLENDDGFITDVQVNNESIIEDGVAKIPTATTTKYGVVKPNDASFYTNSNGQLFVNDATESYIDNRTWNTPITSHNLDIAVRKAMGDGKGAEWSDEEKANAKERIGISNASDTVSGLVKIDNYYGIAIAQSGKLYLNTISKSDYSTSNNAVFISKGTLDNVLSDKIKVNDIKLNNASIVSDGVANIPFADNNRNSHGVVSVNSDSGLFVQNGYMTVDPASADGLSNLRSNLSYRRPIVPYNLDLAVKVAMCDGKGSSWNSKEKIEAQKRIGLFDSMELIEEFVQDSDTEISFRRVVEPNGTPYNFKALHITITSNSPTTSSVNSYFFGDNSYNSSSRKIGYWWSGAKTDNVEQTMYLTATIVNGMVLGKGNTWTNQTNANAFVSISGSDNLLPSDVTSIKAFEVGRLQPNATVKIYGIRA